MGGTEDLEEQRQPVVLGGLAVMARVPGLLKPSSSTTTIIFPLPHLKAATGHGYGGFGVRVPVNEGTSGIVCGNGRARMITM